MGVSRTQGVLLRVRGNTRVLEVERRVLRTAIGDMIHVVGWVVGVGKNREVGGLARAGCVDGATVALARPVEPGSRE